MIKFASEFFGRPAFLTAAEWKKYGDEALSKWDYEEAIKCYNKVPIIRGPKSKIHGISGNRVKALCLKVDIELAWNRPLMWGIPDYSHIERQLAAILEINPGNEFVLEKKKEIHASKEVHRFRKEKREDNGKSLQDGIEYLNKKEAGYENKAITCFERAKYFDPTNKYIDTYIATARKQKEDRIKESSLKEKEFINNLKKMAETYLNKHHCIDKNFSLYAELMALSTSKYKDICWHLEANVAIDIVINWYTNATHFNPKVGREFYQSRKQRAFEDHADRLLAKKNDDEAIEYYSRALEVDVSMHDKSTQDRISEKMRPIWLKFFKSGQYTKAVKYFPKTIKDQSENTLKEYYSNRGDLLYCLGHYEDALQCYSFGMGIFGLNSDKPLDYSSENYAYFESRRCRVLIMQKRFEEALDAYNKISIYHPKLFSAYIGIIKCLHFLNRNREANKVLDKDKEICKIGVQTSAIISFCVLGFCQFKCDYLNDASLSFMQAEEKLSQENNIEEQIEYYMEKGELFLSIHALPEAQTAFSKLIQIVQEYIPAQQYLNEINAQLEKSLENQDDANDNGPPQNRYIGQVVSNASSRHLNILEAAKQKFRSIFQKTFVTIIPQDNIRIEMHAASDGPLIKMLFILKELSFAVNKTELSSGTEGYVLTIKCFNTAWANALESALNEVNSLYNAPSMQT